MRVALVGSSGEARELVSRLLEARSHEVFSFANTNDALARLTTDASIDALITSADAAPMSGVELCWEARLLAGRRRALYVLFMAAPQDQMTKVEALDGGADDVIDMPPLPAELCAKLRAAERMLKLKSQLIQSATTDPLSRVHNRGAFFEEATEACREASLGGSLAVILLDVDHLKAINDHYGHDVGDRAIRAVASVAQRGGALVGRLGGDEFGILLEGHMLSDALELAADLQQNLAKLKLETSEGPMGLTCSLGVSELQPGDTIDDLMKRADLALYRAKAEGRSRVATAPATSMSEGPPPTVRLTRSLPRPAREVKERRLGRPPGDGLLARVCAVIDLLIASGLSEADAAQAMAQRMVAANIPPPRNAADGTWWTCILAWRAAFRDGVATDEALKEYRNVVAAIESIPPLERVDCVLDNELWNRRRLILRRRPVSCPLH
jgi:diguanylate cyclase (GGDEF)-like protein